MCDISDDELLVYVPLGKQSCMLASTERQKTFPSYCMHNNMAMTAGHLMYNIFCLSSFLFSVSPSLVWLLGKHNQYCSA